MSENKKEKWEWMKAVVIAFVLVFVIRTFLVTPIIVDGASMNTTLLDKDRMIVNKIDKPERFDIVVFHANENEDYIKRVIGLPGDRIEYKDDTLYVNGKAFDEPYLEKQKQEILDGKPLTPSFSLEDTAVGQQTVPEGHIFVMGDNRRYSKDSRLIGAVPLEEVVGTTNIVYWPIKEAKVIHQ
ncbi:signal peptidase I [Rossellomorea aquimaris]|uniref:signal peptidase I n=1 Tax=Rossellomorea aquimaris TaxID=189382 RepID=UPI001CD2FB8F|nr:signal peptidase I [Rossellomorea aquimaris]MCA1055809.1 signal peptidase I [Rossellomorea aquimaris]